MISRVGPWQPWTSTRKPSDRWTYFCHRMHFSTFTPKTRWHGKTRATTFIGHMFQVLQKLEHPLVRELWPDHARCICVGQVAKLRSEFQFPHAESNDYTGSSEQRHFRIHFLFSSFGPKCAQKMAESWDHHLSWNMCLCDPSQSAVFVDHVFFFCSVLGSLTDIHQSDWQWQVAELLKACHMSIKRTKRPNDKLVQEMMPSCRV